MKTFLGLSLFLLKERGCAIAMKGPNVQEEIDIASQDAGLDALHLANNSEILLPITHEKRRVVVYAKS